jgi:arginine exporter protein ArgO
MRALLEGIVAGLGIAVPVGPIAVLLVDRAMRRGFADAIPAALGTASADLIYATVAALLGAAAADGLRPLERPLHVTSAVVLLAIAGVRVWRLLRARDRGARLTERVRDRGNASTYLAFLGLTLLNPVTVAYFAALILGLQSDSLTGTTAKTLFVAGAFAASAAWQVTLVGAGAVFHHRLSPNASLVTGLIGNTVIVLLAVRLLVA